MAPISKMAGYRPEKGRLQRMSRHEAARTPLERLALESMAGGRWSVVKTASGIGHPVLVVLTANDPPLAEH
jgi:hypothetical protein